MMGRHGKLWGVVGLMVGACLLGSGPTAIGAGAVRAAAQVDGPRSEKGFYLKNRDRVVFYGDSITDQRLYTTYIETYCVTRFPKSHFTFVHSGWGGDRVTGGGGGPIDMRLDRDVFAYKPTVVTICLGMNDGAYRAFDQNIYNTYVSGYRHILDRLIKELPGVRITLLTASPYDDVTRAANFPAGYNATLVAYGEAVKALGKEYGLTVADTNAPLVAALAKANVVDAAEAPQILRDRVHPGPGGHVVMAAAVLKAWNAPSTVADIEIDAATKAVVRQQNSRISGLDVTADKIQFTHLDGALPWPLDRDPEGNKDTGLVLAVTDEEQALNRDVLKIDGLTASRYALKVDGKEIGELSREDLAAGVDMAGLPALPDNAQAREVLALTRKHNDLRFRAWREIRDPRVLEIKSDVKVQIADLEKQEADVVAQQWLAAQPKPHHVELTAAP